MREQENHENVKERKTRRKIIVDIISEMEIRSHQQLMDELKKRGIESSQSTISRDLYFLGISKSETAKKYVFEDARKYHFDQLKDYIKRNNPKFYPRVSLRYFKIGYGYTSVYAHHLKNAFPDVILDVKIGIDSLLILIDENADREELKKLEELEELLSR